MVKGFLSHLGPDIAGFISAKMPANSLIAFGEWKKSINSDDAFP
jgi:hypothetical protein